MKILRRAAPVIVLVVLLVGVARWAVRPRYDLGEGDLLRRATRVCAWPGYVADYVWVSDHEMIRLVNDPRRPVDLLLERANLATGARTPLPAFNTTFLRLTRGLQAYTTNLAPDGATI